MSDREAPSGRSGPTLKVGDESLLPSLGHVLQLGLLTQDSVRELGAERCSSEVERAECDGGWALGCDAAESGRSARLVEGEEEASTIGKEELKSDVTEEILAFVYLEQV